MCHTILHQMTVDSTGRFRGDHREAHDSEMDFEASAGRIRRSFAPQY
jgi:hypothetical protein